MLGLRAIALLACAAVVTASVPFTIRRVDDFPPVNDDTFANGSIVVNHRLPNNTRPIAYDLQLTTNIHTQTDFTFTGEVAIQLRVISVSRAITLHHRGLTIGAVNLSLASNPQQLIPLDPFHYNADNEFLTFTVAQAVPDLQANSDYILTIQFDGRLRFDEAGFYRSSYISDNGTRRWLATTQFQATEARSAFPCYDEPALRSLFALRITHGASYHALSNMPIISNTTQSGMRTTTFQVTPVPIPTYVIAFIVSDFESIAQANSRGFVQRVFARPNAIGDGHFALSTGVRSLDAFESYLGGFALPKMDQVAVPDFAAGAMENWGLVTYREEYLLFNEGLSTHVNRENIATIIAHEYAHQWFGNLVTPKWWTYLWLNEGFATLFENYGTDWIFPDWKIMDTFAYAVVQRVMVSDASTATRPMTHYVESAAAIDGLFDNIVYDKAGSVLHMFLHAFTENTFKRGLTEYLSRHANASADEENLFAALQLAVEHDRILPNSLNVSTIFSSWSRQAGFPVVTVERNYQTGEIHLDQQRYFTDRNIVPTVPTRWWIPLNFATASDANFSSTAAATWFGERSLTLRQGIFRVTDWFLLNKRQTGYYRVMYDRQNYRMLADALERNHSRIHLVSRAQLIDDAFEFAGTERLGYDVVLDLMRYMENEVEYVPWASAFRGLERLDRLFAGSPFYNQFANFMQKQLTRLYTETGLNSIAGEHHFRKSARNLAIDWACHFGQSDCLVDTWRVVDSYITYSNTTSFHQDHRGHILRQGMRNVSDAQHQQVLDSLAVLTDQVVRYRVIDALAFHRNTTLVQRYLVATVTAGNTLFRTQTERYRGFWEAVGVNQAGTELGIRFLMQHLDAASEQYSVLYVNRAIVRLSLFVVSEERSRQFNELLNFAETKPYIWSSFIESARTNVANNQKWIVRNSPVIEEWFNRSGANRLVMPSVILAVLVVLAQMF